MDAIGIGYNYDEPSGTLIDYGFKGNVSSFEGWPVDMYNAYSKARVPRKKRAIRISLS